MQRRDAQQCRLRRISASKPSHRMRSQGGVTEIWDPAEDQFQCAGFAPMRDTIQTNSLSLPKFFPAPRLVYIEQGTGVMGISYPGCPETYHKDQQFSSGQGQRGMSGDQHQKVHRILRGDVVAVPAGAAHWCYNDGNEELIAVSVLDLNNNANQLDQNLRGFMLAGGQSRHGQERYERSSQRYAGQSEWSHEETFHNIFRGFDEELMAEAFNVPRETVKRMRQDSNRGLIVKCREDMRIMSPDQEEQEEFEYSPRNGLEETFCTMKIKHNIELQRQADVYTKQGGRINIANQQKLPILQFLDMSAERGHLMPNALYTPHWSMTDNRVVYALRGELNAQIVDERGNTIMNERVREGEMFVIPQFYATLMRAGNDGFEWVSFKSSSQPMKNPMAGSISVMRAMPIDVISNAYQISPSEAEQLKTNRDPQSMLLSPARTSS
ncbi:11S GLOBULIN SEED STORAGE PROTEIN 2-LIKE [Salix purpurea]|uniref:11S GLOBULIN SEED STORAGE PROTEIN 2-LIKE n=1 Tax=Salix purpurea TaxID=77065 RepID=A0A9Q1AJJ7_SALPP|nr:11S GLOBULIN SEED STORAGE PROTEIN 2-LIKE [Salix purpurea]